MRVFMVVKGEETEYGYEICGVFEHYGNAEEMRDELRVGLSSCDFVEIEIWDVK